jgi:hypothetical protein
LCSFCRYIYITNATVLNVGCNCMHVIIYLLVIYIYIYILFKCDCVRDRNCWYSFWYGDVSPGDSLLGSDLLLQSCKKNKQLVGCRLCPLRCLSQFKSIFWRVLSISISRAQRIRHLIPGVTVLFIGQTCGLTRLLDA